MTLTRIRRGSWRRATAVARSVAALALLAGCASLPHRSSSHDSADGGAGAITVAAGSSTHTITVGGRTRAYHVYRPRDLPPSEPVPLVVMLHGGFGSGTQAEKSYGWDSEADRRHFVVAYPDGIDHAWAVGGGCCGTPARTGVDDVGFITAMLGVLGRALPIDPRRVYATGISNGGMLAYRLACGTRLFAAIGPDSATLLGPCPSPAPVSVIHIHGTADHNIPYGGGRGDGPARIDGPAVPALIATWRATDRCPQPSTSTVGPVTTSPADCPGGRGVELITIDGAGHQWPGAASRTLTQRLLGLDPPSTALNATDTIRRFFDGHPAGTSASDTGLVGRGPDVVDIGPGSGAGSRCALACPGDRVDQ